MRAAAGVRDVDTARDDHGRTGEPEQHRVTDAQLVADTIVDSVAHADRESDANKRPRDTGARACSVLRRR